MSVSDLLSTVPATWSAINAASINTAAIRLSTSASAGSVMTSDASGNASWASGLTPSALDVSASASGIWAAPMPLTYSIYQVGRSVTIRFPAVTANQAGVGFITVTPGLPAALQPPDSVQFFCPTIDNGAFTVGAGQCNLSPANIFILAPGQSNFSGAGVGGYGSFYISYILPTPPVAGKESVERKFPHKL